MPVTEEELRAALLEMGPTTIKELSSRFKTRIVTKQVNTNFSYDSHLYVGRFIVMLI